MSLVNMEKVGASLVGRLAPEFSAAAVLGDGNIVEKTSLTELLDGSYGVLVFYPLDIF